MQKQHIKTSGNKEINPPMAKRGGVDAPNRFFQFFSEMGRAFLKTKFSAVGSSLGHLSMKKVFTSDLPSWLYN